MRIAFIHPRFPSAQGTGATHSATQIITGLTEAGHDVCVYCTRLPEEHLETTRMELRHLTGNSSHPHTLTRLNKEVVARLNELREFNIVHSYLPRLMPSIARVGEDPNVGTVVTLNAYGGTCAKNNLLYGGGEQCERKSTLRCLNCITRTRSTHGDKSYFYHKASQLFSLQLINSGEDRLEHIDAFQALSPHVKKTYANFGYEEDKIEVIPNILDDRFDVEHDTDFGEPFKLLYVGALKESKGVDRLVDIFAHIYEQNDAEVFLTIVGDGEMRTRLQQQVKGNGLSELVEIRGQVSYEELPAIYASHDVFLYPGRWNEPFGRVFLEAMAAGTPVVATNVGSVRDIVGTAGIITAQDVNSIAKGVLSILNCQTLQKHSKAGKKRIEQYRSSEIIPQFEQLYINKLKNLHHDD